MSPTAELRWTTYPCGWPQGTNAPEIPVTKTILQQKWVQHHIPAGKTEAEFEWRDVETVKETK